MGAKYLFITTWGTYFISSVSKDPLLSRRLEVLIGKLMV